MATPTQKFTTTTTGATNQRPVAVLATQKIDALLGSIIQMDGRQSFDLEKQPLTWKWSFVQVPLGSELNGGTSFTSLRPNDTAVSFIPDKTGTYIVQLIVNDGELDSTPVTATVNIQLSRVPCGESLIPDAHFLWSHISNFWNLVEDREKITTIWSAAIQLLGTELIKLWDTDQNKSLDTIQSTFQRRWQEIPTTTDLLAAPEQRIITGKIDSGTGGTTGTLGETPGVGNTQVFYMPLGSVGDGIATDFTNLKGNYGAKGRILVVNQEGYTISRVSNEDLSLEIGSDLISAVAGDTVTSASSAFVTAGVAPEDIVVIETGDDAGTYKVGVVVDENTLDLLLLNDATPAFIGDTGAAFRVIRPFSVAVVDEEVIPDGQVGVPWRLPQLLHIPSVNFEDEGVHPGDVLVFDVTRGDIGLTAELHCQVVGVDRTRLGFEFTLGTLGTEPDNISRTAFQQLVRDLKIVPPEASDDAAEAAAEALVSFIPTAINLNTRPFSVFRLKVTAKKVIHNSVVVVADNIVSAPALQESIKEPPVVLRENLDYVVENGSIGFISGLFTPEEPAPEILWAECAIFDNADVIESNFGRLVNFTQEDLSSSNTSAPYLSAVKGLFFAFTNGPSVANIRLGLQILLGLPFTEERGVLLELQEDFTTDVNGNPLGRILIEDLDDDSNRTGFRRVYFYPALVGIEDNPLTNAPFAVGDQVERFAPLSKGVEVQDYIKDPLWWTRTIQGLEILKYFTFKVLVDSRVFNSDDLVFAINFVRQIKPAYTQVITTALQEFEDDILIDDTFGGASVLKFYDNVWGLEATKRTSDHNQQGGVLWNAGSPPFNTRSPSMLMDVVTAQSASPAARYAAANGWARWGANASHFYLFGTAADRWADGIRVGDTLHVTEGSFIGDYVINYVSPVSPIIGVEGSPFTFTQTNLDFNIDGYNVEATSATGWDLELVRGRVGAYNVGSLLLPPLEGDILVILPGQDGSGPTQHGLYEIQEVVDANTLVLGWVASSTNPDDYLRDKLVKNYLVVSMFPFGTGLSCTILRREAPTIMRSFVGSGNMSAPGDNTVVPVSGHIIDPTIQVGDHFVLEAGAFSEEFVIVDKDANLRGDNTCTVDWDGISPTVGLVTGLTGMTVDMVGRIIVFDDLWVYTDRKSAVIVAFVDATSVHIRNDAGTTSTRSNRDWHIAPQAPTIATDELVLRKQDGTDASLVAGPLDYRIVRTAHLRQLIEGVEWFYDGGITEQLLVAQVDGQYGIAPDGGGTGYSSVPRDIFTPSMVGQFVSVTGHANPARNGVFFIKGYLDSGRLIVDAAFTETSTTPLTLTFGSAP